MFQRMSNHSNTFDAVVFDMDGTLIEPAIDFQAIRRDLGIEPAQGILETLNAMAPDERRGKYRLLMARELSAARRAKLVDGALDTLNAIRSAGLKTALLTRNARRAMEIVISKFALQFDLPWSRDQGVTKPQPQGILAACRQLGCEPGRTACVGDFRYDIEAANAAGAVSVLLARGARPDFADQARFVITSLPELLDILNIPRTGRG